LFFFNLFLEAGKATASVNLTLTVTFDWRRLQCRSPLINLARLRKDFCSSGYWSDETTVHA
jgi:hypothetical protein